MGFIGMNIMWSFVQNPDKQQDTCRYSASFSFILVRSVPRKNIREKTVIYLEPEAKQPKEHA